MFEECHACAYNSGPGPTYSIQVQQRGSKCRIHRKLARIIRQLCSVHIFSEVTDSSLANNRVLAALVDDPGLRAYVQFFGLHIYAASEHLPRYLLGSKDAAYKVNETAFHDAMATDKPLWEWMTERCPPDQDVSNGPIYPSVPDFSDCDTTVDADGCIGRPELDNFALAMVAGGKTSGAAHAFGKAGMS